MGRWPREREPAPAPVHHRVGDLAGLVGCRGDADREQGHGWAEIGAALDMDAAQARQVYLERVQQQQRVHEACPDLRHLLGYDPRWAELAAPNDADRVDQQRQAGGREAER
jgi:hypothetical protein